MSRTRKIAVFVLLLLVLMTGSFLSWVQNLTAEYPTSQTWGVTFSDSQAEYLGLSADEVYSAIINDLGVKEIKLHVNWNATEPTPGNLDLTRLDRRIREAEENGFSLILVIGMKTGRWPECHTPEWFQRVPEAERKDRIVQYVTTLVGRYKNSPAVTHWQIENEPFLEFGTCPDWYYEQGTSLIEAEVAAVRALDNTRPIIISESGELSTWTRAAGLADVVGVTMYRNTWNKAEKTFGLNPYTFWHQNFTLPKLH